MKTLITKFQQSSMLFQQAVEKVPPEKKELVLFDQWTLKDIVAHILGWHQLFLDNLQKLSSGKIPQDWGKIDEFNQKNVVKFKSVSFPLLFSQLQAIDLQLISQLSALSLSEGTKKFWPNRSYTPQKILEIEIKHYLKTHIPQITNKI